MGTRTLVVAWDMLPPVMYLYGTMALAAWRGPGGRLVVPRHVPTARDTRPGGRAEDDVCEAMVRRDGHRSHAPGRPDTLCDSARGPSALGVCGRATRGSHPPLSALSFVSSLSSVSSLSWLVSPFLPVVRGALQRLLRPLSSLFHAAVLSFSLLTPALIQ